MIKSAAASVSGSLALGLGAQAAPADDAAVSTDFAALLDSTVATGQDDGTDPAALLEQMIGKQMRQATVTAAGKKLPHGLPNTASALALSLADAAKPADGSTEDSAATVETTPALPAITTPIVLPGLVVPISVQLPQTPLPAATPATTTPAATGPTASGPRATGLTIVGTPTTPTAPAVRQSTTESLAQAAAAQVIRLAPPGATEAGRAAKADRAGAPAPPVKTSGAQLAASLVLPQTTTTALPASPASSTAGTPIKADGPVAAPATSSEPALAATILAGLPTRADQIGVTIAPAEKAVSTQAPATPAMIPAAISAAAAATTAAVTIIPGSPTADQIRVTVAPTEQPAPAATSTSAQLASAQAAGSVISQVTGRAAATTKTAVPKVQQLSAEPATPAAQATEIAPAQAPAQTAAQTAANAAQPNTTAAPRREVTTPAADAPASLAKATAAAVEAPAAPAQTPAAMPAQPLFGLQDGQSFSQAAAPVTSAPATSSVGQTGHDFAALVDRLVDARDAAAPASVNAAIKHSEFGQVSLRFDQDASGLSVAMSSADPEFARAVQASSAQSQMSGDNGSDKNHDWGNGAQRQDTSSQQQTAGSSSGQSQSQAQAQAQSSTSGRGDRNSQTPTDSRTGRTSGQPTQDADTATTRGGIYA